MATVKIESWSRCAKCDKFESVQKEFEEGDKVNFPKVRRLKNSTRISVMTGKIFAIKEDSVMIIYRKQMSSHPIADLSDPNGASGLSVSMIGQCECGSK
ncbi:hypothetical protein VPHK45_0049 [Vibrio phage K45]